MNRDHIYIFGKKEAAMIHKCRIDIRFRDIDMMGHVNNAVYMSYLEQARIRFADDVLGTEVNWSEQGIILARVEINFLKPILHKDELWVRTECTEIGNKSFQLTHLLVVGSTEHQQEVSSAKCTLVCYNYRDEKSIEIPYRWRELLEKYAQTTE